MTGSEFDELCVKFLHAARAAFPVEYESVIFRAFEEARTAHAGQKRESGEPYFIHPVCVASILQDLGLDAPSVAAALLHDVVEDTDYTQLKVNKNFGKEIGSLVAGLTKLDKIVFTSKEEEQAENFRKMFVAMAKDIRVLIIKLADRLHNMRTVGALPLPRQTAMATETLEIYAPLASRLGLSYMKCELEDLCLSVLHPDEYQDLVRRIIHKRAERQKIVDTLCERLRTMLAGLHIEGEVSGRPKHFYSIYKKMVVQNRPFEQIYDLTAVRVIVQTVNDCYEVLGKIHAEWKPVPGRFKDYISVPKQNGYQSLHTTIMSNLGQPFEIQIRTREMHKVAEFGIAAHWKYKEKRENDSDLDQRMGWLRELMTLQGDAESTKEFLDGIKIDLYTDKIFVFTPKGDIVELPVGSTPIDFAYHVHSNVGNRCVGAKINSRMMPLNTKLQSGDFVEIVTSSAAKGPSRDWLKVAVSPNARAKIRAFFKKEMKEENIKLGRDMLEAEAKRKGVALPVLMRQEWLDPLMARLSLSSAEDMYAAVGYGGITTNQIIIKLYDLYRKEQKKAEAALKVDEKKLSNGGQNAVTIKGNDGLLVKLARCCSPVPGDDIIAFISRGRGAVVHRKSCVNIKALEPERLVEAAWAGQSSGFLCGIRILAEDRYGLLVRVAGVIAEQRLSIASIEARVDKQGVANISLSVTVSQTADIENLFKKLQQMPEVITVIRV